VSFLKTSSKVKRIFIKDSSIPRAKKTESLKTHPSPSKKPHSLAKSTSTTSGIKSMLFLYPLKFLSSFSSLFKKISTPEGFSPESITSRFPNLKSSTCLYTNPHPRTP